MVKKIDYEEEGLGKFYPEDSKNSQNNLKVVRFLDNLRSPPGLFQILETVNKLNKTNDNLISDLIKYLKSTGLINFDKNVKNSVFIEHSFGLINYSFEDFVESNRGGINQIYKKLFDNQSFYFLDKHDINYESVNKWYKSDVYRNFINNFFQEVKYDDSFYVLCLDHTKSDVSKTLFQLKTFSIESLISDNKKKYPVRMFFQDFCRTFLDLVSHKVENQEIDHNNFLMLAKNILKLSKIKIDNNEVLFGKNKIFLKYEVYSFMIQKLREYQLLLQKWQGFLRIKIQNFRIFTIRKKFIREIRKKKLLAKNILNKMVCIQFYGYKFKTYLSIVLRIQRNFKNKKVFSMLFKVVKIIRKTKWKVLKLIAKFKYKRIKRNLLKIQRAVRRFLQLRKTRKLIFVRKIVKNIIESTFEIVKKRKIKFCLSQIAKLVYRSHFFDINKVYLSKLRKYLIEKLTSQKAIVIQKNWKTYFCQKKFKKLKKCVVLVQKNMKRFVWRRNYLRLKNGIVKIQTIWRKYLKSKKGIPQISLSEENKFQLKRTKMLEKLFLSQQKRVLKKQADNHKNIAFLRPQKLIFFSYILDIEVLNFEKDVFDQIYDAFEYIDEQLLKTNDEIVDLTVCESYIWSFTSNFDSYCIGKCIFMNNSSQKTEPQNNLNDINSKTINKFEFHGSFPNFIESGNNHTIMLYQNFNELKFLGDFDFYGSEEIIRKKNNSLTIRFDDDFKIQKISAKGNSFGMLSTSGEVICWPFNQTGKLSLTRLNVKLKHKIIDISCGSSFIVFRTINGKIAVSSNGNKNGELGIGNFENTKKVEIVCFFQEFDIFIEKIAAGDKHVLALSKDGRLYGWGSNFDGQIGSKPCINHSSPRLIPFNKSSLSSSKIIQITAGLKASFLLLKNQKVR